MAGEEEFDIVVIGGGPGGYATALYGAAAGLSVAIVERDKVGGTCLHRGCIPAKAFLETAAVRRTIEGSKEFGIDVVSDSTYVVKCFTDRWWEGWQRRGWTNSQRKPVANRDLWEPLLELALAPDVPVTFRGVKGHSGDRWNDRVDELATLAADTGAGSSGSSG